MGKFKNNISDFLKNSKLIQKFNYNQSVFYFLFSLKNKCEQFKININSNCLVFSHYPGAETKGLGGLIAQNPKNFEVLCLTNGADLEPDLDAVDCTILKKQQFQDVMKTARVKGFKIFDVDSKTLKSHGSTFKKIDISEADYIFVPNLYDTNSDAVFLLKHFKNMLEEKEYKPELKILMYESDFPLNTIDYYVNISTIIETKKTMLLKYYPLNKFPDYIQKILGLNLFRALQFKCEYCETFLSFGVEEFLNIPLI